MNSTKVKLIASVIIFAMCVHWLDIAGGPFAAALGLLLMWYCGVGVGYSARPALDKMRPKRIGQ